MSKMLDFLKPKYLMMGKSDNGFTIAFWRSYALTGRRIQRIGFFLYEALLYSDADDYELLESTSYVFRAEGKCKNPDTWKITPEEGANEASAGGETFDSAKKEMSVEKLLRLLRQMEILFFGDVKIQVGIFDDYHIVCMDKEWRSADGENHWWQSDAIFYRGKIMRSAKRHNYYSDLGEIHRRRS